jgi:hypothetical protein
MRAEHFAQRRVHQVRRCVIATSRVALFNINLACNYIANVQHASLDSYFVHDEPLHR